MPTVHFFTKWILVAGIAGSFLLSRDLQAASTNGDSSIADSLIAEAYKLTASGNRSEAEEKYRQLVDCCPDAGYPAYARYLSRTGQTTAVEALVSDAALAAQPPFTRARTLVSVGRRADAIDLLRNDQTSAGLHQRTLLLANQLEQLGETEAAAVELENVVTSDGLDPADRRDLFRRLLLTGGSDRLATVIPEVVENLVTSSTFTYPQVREIALAGLTTLSMGPDYANFHARLEKAMARSPALAWLYALSCLMKGDGEMAQAALESLATSTMTDSQRVVCLEELASLVGLDTPRVISIYEEILPLSNDQERIRLYLAQHQFRAKNFSKVNEILKPLDFDQLEAGEQQAALNLYMTSMGATGPMPQLIDELLRVSANLPYEKVREIAASPFVHFNPDNQQALRTAVRERLDGTTGTANALILLMGLENLVGNHEEMYEALGKYVEARPNEADAARELANGLASEAWHLVADNQETSPPLEELEKAANVASEALWKSIRLKPYTPEPYEKLIALYRLFNQPEKAREVPLFLSERPNALPEEVHLAAYVYATQGYPELAIPLYERALKMQNDTRYRLNYAAALGRVGRYEEAMEIYRDLMKNGVNGHQYHVHEVHLSALNLMQKHGMEKEHLDFLMSLLNDPEVPQRDVFLLEEGRVLASAGLYQEALHFFYKLKEEFPEEAVSATDIIVSTYAAMKDFETARKVLNEEIARTTEAESLAFLRNNLALTYRLEGQVDTAVAQWQQLADELPTERQATRALLNAARALAQSGRIEQAREYYSRFIRLNTGDVTGEQIARDEVMRLDRMEVPTNMLVQSAMLEYGPEHVDHDHGPGHDVGEEGERAEAGDDHDDHDHDDKPQFRLDYGRETGHENSERMLNIEGEHHDH